MKAAHLCDVQRIVLRGGNWRHARHFAVDFGAQGAAPRHFLYALRDRRRWPTAAGQIDLPRVQTSLGFTRRGLEHAGVPAHVLSCFALKSPAFYAGAALRTSRHLGMVGPEAPGTWEAGFGLTTLDAVISLHADDEDMLTCAAQDVEQAAAQSLVPVRELQHADRLPPHPAYPADKVLGERAMWVHFGYRDGLSRVRIEGYSEKVAPEEESPRVASQPLMHAVGEFVLGHVQDCGGNPWIAGPGRSVWSRPVRSFFLDGSFGVLHQIEQNVKAFEDFVQQTAKEVKLGVDELKAKLCGRFPDGRPIGRPAGADPEAEFDYADDLKGVHCPFGAHVRRMNPRASDPGDTGDHGLAHFSRTRPLLRRGLPYGPAAWGGAQEGDPERGLMAQFFCASIEDQYEHLVGQWADRVPLGSPDRGGARDPFSGAHDGGDGPFEVPQPGEAPPLMLRGLKPFTRTRGIAYLFYPSAPALEGIAKSEPWLERDEGVV